MMKIKLFYIYISMGLCLNILNCTSATADGAFPSKIMKGKEYRIPLSVTNSRFTSSGLTVKYDAALFLLATTKYSINTHSVLSACQPSSTLSWTSDHRYYGLTLAKDTVLAVVDAVSFAEAELKDEVSGKKQKFTGGGQWDSSGRFTPKFSLSSGGTWCSGKPFASTEYVNGGPEPSTLTGELVLYAGPNADLGTIEIPTLAWGAPVEKIVYSQQSVEIIEPLVCRVSTPPKVDFGQVNITGVPEKGLLGVQKQGIDISCSPASSLADKVTISFTGSYEGGYFGRLSVTDNSSGKSMGYIRGRYLDAGGSCGADSQNDIGFNGVNGVKILNKVGGSINVPITWSLCANNSGLLGEGSAQATVKVDWD
ncbi:TPA: hypothetical protein RG501_RS10680 [Providencia rettgeri]|nr:hypothetical protein [Providencia rettgeri]